MNASCSYTVVGDRNEGEIFPEYSFLCPHKAVYDLYEAFHWHIFT